MKKRIVNLGRSDEHIADQYPNIFEGLQKDAGQNSWDARQTKKGKGWKLVFRYIPDRNILVFEDFGTVGMNEKRWAEYQSLWDTSKAEEATLGARGQGKFLFHYFSAKKLVLTESIDKGGKYRFSFGTTEEWDDESKQIGDFIPGAKPLDHQGTRIWIMDVKKHLLVELLDHKAFMEYVTSTWWEIIRNWGAVFIVNFDGVDRQVMLPELPPIEKERSFRNQKIKDLGVVKTLRLWYCKDELPKHLRGVAVQRGGMTILRLPAIAEEKIKNKICGYCDFDKDLERELKKVEYPNHFGFNSKRAWNHTREYIRRKLDEFVQEISPKKRKMEVKQELIDEAVRLTNDLVREYAPELIGEASAPGAKNKKKRKSYTLSKPPPIVRIDTFRANAAKFEYNETLIIDCEIVNETSGERDLLLLIEVKHAEGDLKHKSRYKISIDGYTRKNIDIPLIDFEEKMDKPGQYRSTAVLEDAVQSEQLHRRSFTFYLHEEPPKIEKNFLSNMQYLMGRGKPFEKQKQLPVTDKGILYIVYDHPDFTHVRERAGSKRSLRHEIFLYSVKSGVDGAIQKLLEFKYNEDQLDSDEIRGVKNICDEMYYNAVRRCEA